jgi:outer membrane protein TolC
MGWKREAMAFAAAAWAATAPLPGAAEPEAPPPVEGEGDLGQGLDLATATRVALARNPDLREAADQVDAAEARSRAAGRLPDLAVQTQLWQQPLATPFDFSRGGMLMAGLRQTFPAPGSLSARERAGKAGTAAARAGSTARGADLVQQVRRAYAQYWLAEQEQLIHLEHMEITDRIVQEARSYFQQGQLSKADYLRTTVELARVHTILSDVAQQRRASGALLNTLMGREPDAPLGTPRQVPLPSVEPPTADLEPLAIRKPEVVAAEEGVARARAQLDAMEAEAAWPEFMVGLDYGYMPMDRTSNYTAMLGFTLPWLSPRRGDDRRAAAASLAAAEHALASARNQARYQLRDAVVRYRAARDSHDLIEQQLLPQTEQAAEASQEAFRYRQADALGLLDALRNRLQVRLELVRARARVQEAWADLGRSAGEPMETARLTEGGKP